MFWGYRRLLKNTHLPRCAHHSSLRRTQQYASFLMMSRALHPRIFEQPFIQFFFNNMAGHSLRDPNREQPVSFT
jgi:hypothetical protein